MVMTKIGYKDADDMHLTAGRFVPGAPGMIVFQGSFYHPKLLRPAFSNWFFPLETAYRVLDELKECIKQAEEIAKEYAKSDVEQIIDEMENEIE
ncbi:MAG: hypothetical protein EBW87_00635 [Burkholderiaceae bacterium]|nr:hypothetical protein [Burkholderiaceae bacterium]